MTYKVDFLAHGQRIVLPSGLRVGIDGFNLAMPRGTGVATYGRVLADTLVMSGCKVEMLFGLGLSQTSPALLRQIMFYDKFDQEGTRKAPRLFSLRWLREVIQTPLGIRPFDVPVDGQVITSQFANRLPKFNRLLNATDLFDVAHRYFRRTGRFLRVKMDNPPDIMHWTYPLPLTMDGARNVYTLHDLVPLRLPYTTLDNKRSYLRLVRGCLRYGHRLCTVSEASRKDIMVLLGAPAEKICNTYQTSILAPLPVFHAELEAWLDGLFNLKPDGYFLFFGALEPKKNVGRLIEAYLSSGVETPFVIVGGRSWRSESELRLLDGKNGRSGSGKNGRIEILEYVPAPWLTALVQGARCVVFPSIYEGFGLPVLEAMQQGTPVITSTESSLPEVAGDAAVLVNPYDTREILSAIRSIDSDAQLRQKLRMAGPLQADQFSRSAYMSRLTDMYTDLMSVPL